MAYGSIFEISEVTQDWADEILKQNFLRAVKNNVKPSKPKLTSVFPIFKKIIQTYPAIKLLLPLQVKFVPTGKVANHLFRLVFR